MCTCMFLCMYNDASTDHASHRGVLRLVHERIHSCCDCWISWVERACHERRRKGTT